MTVMTVTSLPKDKPKIAAHAAMMFVQNFGFMLLYFSIWGETPFDETCNSTRFAVGYMTLSCHASALPSCASAFQWAATSMTCASSPPTGSSTL